MQRYGIEVCRILSCWRYFTYRYPHAGRDDIFAGAATAFGSLYGLLSAEESQFAGGRHWSGEICAAKGIAELARRYFSLRMTEEPSLVTPSMTREFLQSQLADEEREIFMVIF